MSDRTPSDYESDPTPAILEGLSGPTLAENLSNFDHSSKEMSVDSSNGKGSSNAKVSQQSYWERLPIEIWGHIFFLCLPPNKDQVPSKAHAPYLLTLVCQCWYNIIAELPIMWSTVVLTTAGEADAILPSHLQAGTRHLEISIARSGTTTMQIYTRAEFIADEVSFDHIRRIAARISHLTITYPLPPNMFTVPHYFPPSGFLAVPNLQVLEVHAHHIISDYDLMHLDYIMNSARTLKRYVSSGHRTSRVTGPSIVQNMFNLEALTLQELVPIPLCFFILKNIPTLQKLSLFVAALAEDMPIYNNKNLLSILSINGMVQPFIHPRLRYLALAHYRCDLSTFFECATLPLLQFLVLDFPHGRSPQALWPHDHFTCFLQRSHCKLKSFHILDEPITSSQLLQLLHLPHMMYSLEYLGIQHYRGGERVIDDSVLQQLTLPPITPREVALATESETTHNNEQPILCPDIERLILFVPLEGFTLSKLITMFGSRLSSNANSTTAPLQRKCLRHVEMDYYNEMKPDFGPLREKGLVLTLFEPLESNPMPTDEKQQSLWRRHLTEGLDDEVFDHETGTWRPADMTLAML